LFYTKPPKLPKYQSFFDGFCGFGISVVWYCKGHIFLFSKVKNNNNPPPQPLNVVNGLPQHIPEQNSADKNMLPTQFNDDKSKI